MRNALLFLTLMLASLVCMTLAVGTHATAPAYGLQTPPPVTQRFDAATRSYLEPARDISELLALQ